MIKENMESRQIVFLIVMFIFGSSIIMGINTDVAQDSWIAIVIAIFLSLPLGLMYARIVKLNPGDSLFDIAEKLFGKVIGKVINIFITWYAFHLGTMVLCNFVKYIELSSLLNTPEVLVAALMVLVAVYIVKSSITTLGKWSAIILPIVMLIVLLTVIMAASSLDVNNILPLMSHSPDRILKGSMNILAFPLAETMLILCLACFFKKEDSPYKIYMGGLLIGGGFLLAVFLRNLLVLGAPMISNIFFPSYVAARIIEFGDFITRMEGVITINFVLAGITKIAVCLLAASKGMTKLFNTKNYKDLVLPSALIILAMSTFLYNSVLEMFDFIKIYSIYAFPFQIIIPLIIWIASERRAKKERVAS